MRSKLGMNASTHIKDHEVRTGSEQVAALLVGFVSLALWVAFTPYVALEQARQLALCLAMICGTAALAVENRARKKIAWIREMPWPGAHESAA